MKISSIILQITRRKGGLTLIELVVVIAIFSIFSGMLFTVFKSSLDTWRRAENLLDVYQSARLALEQMSREISAALVDQTSSDTTRWAPFRGIDEYQTKIKGATSIEDEIFFVAPVENAGDMDLCEIGYWLRNDNRLMRHFQKFDSPEDLPITYNFTDYDSDDELAANVVSFSIYYYYRGAAGLPPNFVRDSWNSTQDQRVNYNTEGIDKKPDGLPEAVSITIGIQEPKPINPASPKTWTFTTVVVIKEAR